MTAAGTDSRDLQARYQALMAEQVYALEAPFLQHGWGAVLPALEESRTVVKARGLWAPYLPPAYGGLGLALREFAHVSEILGQSPLGHFVCNCQAPDIGNMELLLEHGSTEQQEQYLRPLAAGMIRSCFAMTEPEHAGSNPVRLSTTAVEEGDSYVIDGHKWFTSAADGASFAIVMAITEPGASELHRRASQIIVPLDTPGFEVVRNIRIMGEAGEGYMSHAEVRLHEVRVPRTHLLGKQGEGFALAQARLGPGRIHHCMRWIGICERALDLMCQRAATRELAPGRLLAHKQVIQHWIAEARAEINAARLLVLDAAEKIDRAGAQAARVEVSTIKFFVANVLQRVLDHAIQVHGALGVTDDTVLSFWYRHERGARIYDGADEVHKSVVARHVLRRYGVDIRD